MGVRSVPESAASTAGLWRLPLGTLQDSNVKHPLLVIRRLTTTRNGPLDKNCLHRNRYQLHAQSTTLNLLWVFAGYRLPLLVDDGQFPSVISFQHVQVYCRGEL